MEAKGNQSNRNRAKGNQKGAKGSASKDRYPKQVAQMVVRVISNWEAFWSILGPKTSKNDLGKSSTFRDRKSRENERKDTENGAEKGAEIHGKSEKCFYENGGFPLIQRNVLKIEGSQNPL